ncbi:MAG TPA: hypothetical protein VFQ22_11280 [Longimicrobiales bacterium]|nr:hypothetical protein [Longimicrobiales bacterium]
MSALPGAGERLPAVGFSAPSGEAVELRGRHGPVVVLAVGGDECAGCADWVRALEEQGDQLARWGASVFVVLPRGGAGGGLEARAHGTARLVTDDTGALAGGGPGAAVLVADEWGEIYFSRHAPSGRELPGADEVFDWLRFVAIQCPECDPIEWPWGQV